MKRKEMIIMIAFIVFLNVYFVSAMQFYMTKELRQNNTIRLYSFVQYQETELVINKYTRDYIPIGTPMEVAIKYDSYITTWNQRNIYNKVAYCNLSIKYSPRYFNSSILLYNETILDDISTKTFYVTLNKNEEFSINMDCKFINRFSVPQGLEIPASFSVNTPTHECKACQMYQWEVEQKSIYKTKTLGQFTLNIISYVGQVISINFESLISLFWIALIFIFLYSFSLLFEVAIFLIKFVNGIGK